ncbi:MAG: chloride channel protein [Oscillospiraceae bacterium]|nr:chloride channel protein [Oscillospiraceae bacterium]
MDYKKAAIQPLIYLGTLAKWMLFSVVTGGVCGLVGVAFHKLVTLVTNVRTEQDWILYLLPAAGLVIVLLYRIAGLKTDQGTNMVLESVRAGDKPPLVMAPLIFIATAITHLFGGSSGREGAALQIGGSIGAALGKLIPLDEKDRRIIIQSGMSAVFAAIFGTPLTASVFAMEVITVGKIHYGAFVPCLLSAVMGYGIAGAFGIAPERFHVGFIPELGVIPVLQTILLASLFAAVSILFCTALHSTDKLFEKYFPNEYIRVFVGGCLIIGLTLLVGCRDYNGAGMNIIELAIEGEGKPFAFLLKILFTAVTLEAGFKGGEIVPSFFIGATLGCTAAPLIGMDAGFGAALGLIGVFCGVVNCPIASLILSIELFGSEGIVFYGVVCAVSYMLSGYFSLYSSQRFLYSKLDTERKI